MKKYQAKRFIEAIQYLGDEKTYNELLENKVPIMDREHCIAVDTMYGSIVTLSKGDYVLKHPNDGYTVCDAETFDQYYEEVKQ